MNTLTKEQVRQLAPELQEAFGSLLADEARHRAELMKKVKGHRDRTWFGQARLGALQGMLALPLFLIVAGGTDSWFTIAGLVACIWAVHGIHLFRSAALERRLDALIELWEADLKADQPQPPPSTE
jgi:predicted membrane-bound spermidine synthase